MDIFTERAKNSFLNWCFPVLVENMNEERVVLGETMLTLKAFNSFTQH